MQTSYNRESSEFLREVALSQLCDSISIVNISQETYEEFDTSLNVLLNKGRYEDRVYSLASLMTKQDRIDFIESTELENICAFLDGDRSPYLLNYHFFVGGHMLYHKLTISYLDETKASLLFLYRNETSHMASAQNALQNNKFFRFIAKHICDNVMEVNAKTGECTVTHSVDGVQIKATFPEQIEWFAHNIIIPEQREKYLQEYQFDNLLSTLEKNNNSTSSIYTVRYADGLHHLLIVRALLREVYRPKDAYIFSYTQDITHFKEQEEENINLLDISKKLLCASQTDFLTGLYNRAAGESFISECLSKEITHPGCLFLLDIDYFKRINDSFGHVAGDHVLKFLADSLRQVFRSDDIICRWGGDEFLIFMRNVHSTASIKSRIHRLYSMFDSCQYNQAPLIFKASVGVAIAVSGDTLDSLYKRADILLYKVKNGGRAGYQIESLKNEL